MRKIILILVVLLSASLVFASTADDISKNVNKLIRSAEKEFFKGKTNEAAKILKQAAAALDQLKAKDPGHKSLKTLQNKYNRLKTRVDKKLGKTASGILPKTKKTSGPVKSSSALKDLSHGAKSNLKKANRELDFAEKELIKGEKSLQDKKFNLVDSYIFNTKSRLESAEVLLKKVVDNNKANPNHPDVASASQRLKAMQEKLTIFTNKAHGEEEGIKQAEAQAKALDANLNQKWLPQITPFTDATSNSRLQYPGSYNQQELSRQEKLYDQAKSVLEDVKKNVPPANQPQKLQKAIEQLRFALQVYEDQKKADNNNRLQPIENTLSGWEKRFEQNKKWTENSEMGLFIITKKKMEYQKKQIAELGKVSTANAAEFNKRLTALEKENALWVEKKQRWMERPRPFPKTNMKSAALEKEMNQLLRDRGIEAKKLVITDKDWWVQPGEFRYVTTAVLSEDNKGTYWTNISFRQMKTLLGYGPTEIYDIDEIRIRLP
jgi:hypothetical protein